MLLKKSQNWKEEGTKEKYQVDKNKVGKNPCYLNEKWMRWKMEIKIIIKMEIQ